MFDITPMLNQPFRTFATAKNADDNHKIEVAKKAGAKEADIANDILKYQTGHNDPHYLSLHTPSGREVTDSEIIAMVKSNKK